MMVRILRDSAYLNNHLLGKRHVGKGALRGFSDPTSNGKQRNHSIIWKDRVILC